MERLFKLRKAFLVLALWLAGLNAAAQDNSFAGRLGYSAELMAEGFGDSHSFATLDVKLRFAVNPWFSVFVPIDFTELLYNKSTDRNYDFAAKSGIGVRFNHTFNSNAQIAASVSGLSTIGKAGGNYWQLRLMLEHVAASVFRHRSVIGVGVQYLSPCDTPSPIGGFYPVVSIGIFL